MKVVLSVLVAAAAVTGGFAWIDLRHAPVTGVDHVGEVIGREGVQPEEIADIKVVTWDAATKQNRVFQVHRKGEGWSIPSHFDYPADAEKQVGQAAGILGVKRGRFVSADPKDFAELGLIDPSTDAALTAPAETEPGRRITIKDGAGATLLDMVVGKSAGEAGSFVREAGSNDIYTAKVDALSLRTSFTDWVKPDLLQVKPEDIRAISVKDYSVDERSQRIENRAELTFTRPTAEAVWASPQAPSGKQPKKADVDGLVNALTWLKLAGIRPFDPSWLQTRGFFLVESPELVESPNRMVVSIGGGRRAALIGNEGETTVATKEGLVYHLFFGEVALGDDEDTSAEAAAKPADKPADKANTADVTNPADPAALPDVTNPDQPEADAVEPAKAKGLNRYLVVFVRYDPEADEVAKAAAKDGAAKPQAGASAEELVKEHRDAVAKANKRFQTFFYVISNDSFAKLRPKADGLFEDKPAEAKARGSEQTISAWLAEHGKTPGVTTTASGLQYEVLDKGPADARQPTDADTVAVRYTGTLINGDVFDTSGEKTTSFGVTGVIRGWTEALKLMRVGAKWKLTIPPGLAYGDKGQGEKIGPNEILQFEVELVDITTPSPESAPAPAPMPMPMPSVPPAEGDDQSP